MSIGAIILAAGRSERMAGKDKLLQPVAGRPLVAHTIACFAGMPELDTIVVVVSPLNGEQIASITRQLHPAAIIVQGGSRRRDSVFAGLGALRDVDYVVVHDGARPMVTPDLVRGVLGGAEKAGAALCAIPVVDTVKRIDRAGGVRSTVSRNELRLAQTPQGFRAELLFRAHEQVREDATDDAALVELLGEAVCTVAGSTRNIKVTSEDDLIIANALLGNGP